MLQDSVTALDRLDDGVALARQTGDPLLVSFALSTRAWAQGIVGSVPTARLDFQEAEEHARESGAAWLEMDAICGRSLAASVMGRFDESRRLAESVLVSNLRFSFPIFEELAVEALAGVDLLTGRYADATAGYARAHALIRQHRLMDGWGWLLPMGRMEALCSMADESGSVGVPDLVRRLQAIEPSMRRMGRLPLYRGCPEVARGLVDSRRGRPDAAMRRFARAAMQRKDCRPSYIDTWVKTRSALEAVRLGRDVDRAVSVLDDVDSEYRQRQLHGMRGWLTDIRRIHGA